MKKSFLTPKCGLDLMKIRTTQRDMLIKVTDEMVVENQIVNMMLDKIIEIVMNVNPDTDTRIILAEAVRKIRELLNGNPQKET